MTNVADDEWVAPPIPDPDMVTASRRHLTGEYSAGVERLFWELEKRPMPDVNAVSAVVSAHEARQVVDALSIGAALVLVQSTRLELDALEAGVFDAAFANGLSLEWLAAVLELPGADTARERRDYLRRRRALARTTPPTPEPGPRPHAAEAAESAGRRAGRAADRAAAAARRQEELRQGPKARRAEPERAAARASEAKLQASEAAERVAVGLLRAASALDRCAVRYRERQGAAEDPKFRQLAEEYASAARRYREIAGRYRDIGGGAYMDTELPTSPDALSGPPGGEVI